MEIPRGDAVTLTQALTRIDSRNPVLTPGAPGESNIAATLAVILERWGFDVELSNAVPGRPNLVARLGPAAAPAILFAGHLDTVDVEGMTHDPFDGRIVDGRIYGRGSTDMKSGVAAMCAAAAIAYDRCGGNPSRQLVIAAVADEEYESVGMTALIDSGISAEWAILTEPTRLSICPAHRGFVWAELDFTGRAAHGSRYDVGIDAITHAGLVIAELDELERVGLRDRSHPLLGRASLHASTIAGGIGISTYPDKCLLSVERRTIPGETPSSVLREIESACERARATRPEISVAVRLTGAQLPSDVAVDAPVVTAVAGALAAENLPVTIEGLSAWTDAALLNEAGIPAICFGPGDIALAHAAEEYVKVDEIESATTVLTRIATDWMMERW
ncbi:MAG TPA: ArgE/DapE family deacylase [Gemmatimonadaceae bacterium]|nr:ArgE/DapE family deacylase [Gemmatimonadaceae bacterium]